ncbi:MAG: hypothetical protein M3M97_08390 [Actinomycetota bacterium]|nr:hypothetical protein [Actinomycetota bacterium]
MVEEAARDGYFDPSWAQKALRLTTNIRTYNARISYLLSGLFSGSTREPDSDRLVLHAIEEIEGTRQTIVADAQLLAELKKERS